MGIEARRLQRSGRAIVALSICVASFGVPTPARASGAEATEAAGLQKFDEGRKAFEAGQFEQALVAFKASYDLLASPNTRLYMGRCYRALGKVASAYTAFRRAAREAQDRLTASGEKRYAATRDAAEHEASELESKVPRLTIAVPAGTPDGFVVKRDGDEVPKAAWGVAVETDPGDVVVEASGPRLVPFQKKVTVTEAAQLRVEIEVRRVPTATIALRMKSRPAGVAVSIDDKPSDDTEADREVDVGAHRVVVNAPGYLPFSWSKDLSDGERETVDVDLRPDTTQGSRGTPPWLFFTVAGGAVAALGVASGIAVHAQSVQNQQLALDPYARDSTVRDSVRSDATIANVLFVGGGVLGAGAVVLAFLTRWRTEQPADVAVAPWIGPSGGGVAAHGSF